MDFSLTATSATAEMKTYFILRGEDELALFQQWYLIGFHVGECSVNYSFHYF